MSLSPFGKGGFKGIFEQLLKCATGKISRLPLFFKLILRHIFWTGHGGR
jgi:hypothetical protein